MTPEAQFEELLETARADESILGVILYGSRAAGMFVRDDRTGTLADHSGRRIRNLSPPSNRSSSATSRRSPVAMVRPDLRYLGLSLALLRGTNDEDDRD